MKKEKAGKDIPVKGKSKNDGGENDDESKETKVDDKPVVSSERFYEVDSSIKSLFGSSGNVRIVFFFLHSVIYWVELHNESLEFSSISN